MSPATAKSRLLVLTSTYPRFRGDPQPAFVHELARRLTDRFEIDVVAPHAPGLAREEVLDGVRIHRFRYAPGRLEDLAYDGGMLNRLRSRPLRWVLVPFYLAAMVLATRRLIRRRGHAVIHAHWLVPQGLAALFCRRVAGRHVPVLCTLHGGDLFGLDVGWANRLRASILRRLDAVTVVSEAMRVRVQALGRDLPESAVIPMGTDLTERFTPDPAVKREPFLLFVGRLVRKKGLDVLLDAFASIAGDHPHLTIVIVGDGPERAALEAQSVDLGIGGSVQFLGSVPNDRLPNLYRRATAAVFPFRQEATGDQEGFGLVVVEAMGCGCPVACGNVPAVKDIVVPGRTGTLVPSENVSDLAENIERLLNDGHSALRMALAARELVCLRFDWGHSVASYNAILDSTIPFHKTLRNSPTSDKPH
jgi:glycosyltransferase involved in cell wall biosynthesis